MLTRKEYLEIRELRRKGWSISAIARHLGRDRKTVRSYLGGDRVAGVRSQTQDASLLFLPYCRQRLADDPHLLASRLFAEVVELGYPGGYSTFTRALRRHLLRPPCADCRPGVPRQGGPADAPQGSEEIRFDWLRLPAPPLRWGCGTHARLLIGTLASSGRWRGVLSDGDDLPHLTEAIDRALRRLGGTPGCWRLDRTPVVCTVSTGWPTPAFAQVARYYGVAVRFGPPGRSDQAGRHGDHDDHDDHGDEGPPEGACGGAALREWWHRLGPGDHGAHGDRRDQAGPPDEARCAALREWWRATGHDSRMAGAQDELDRLAADHDALDAPGLPALPLTPFPAWLCAHRIVGPQGLVPYRDSFYAVQPDLAGSRVEVHRRLDRPYLSIVTPMGAVIARHRLAPPGTARTLADAAGASALERPTRPAHSQGSVCRHGQGRRPLSRQALAEARALRVRLEAEAQTHAKEEAEGEGGGEKEAEGKAEGEAEAQASAAAPSDAGPESEAPDRS
ncbi:Mu transposase domain-containing protein [Streptomyces sp. NPDC101160]|uniref:Mu transposase domain-containing protein n=1 Tax=Streptomyces sp. NPDC101160 TaxID=3366118 RepID=UPI003821AA8E